MKKINLFINCKWCDVSFKITPSILRQQRKCCSSFCGRKYLWSNKDYRDKMSKIHKGKKSNNALEIFRLNGGKSGRSKGMIPWNKGLKLPQISGENNYRWIKDRNLLIKSENKHLDGRYREWMKAVKNRDNWKCRIADVNCEGRLEAHHILNWKDYIELRYEINNGITLCHAHHPRGRMNEAKLSPFFKSLVAEMN